MFKLFLLASVFNLVTAIPADVSPCSKGPAYWCLNETTQRECGAISYCKVERNIHETESNEPLPLIEVPELVAKPDASPVFVSLYFESLCPGCRQAILQQIYPTYLKLASSGILHVNFVPFGNAVERPYGSSYYYQCQHGAAECLGNKIESCAIHLYPNPATLMPFMHCIELYGPTETNTRYCAYQTSPRMDSNAIMQCARGALGTSLEHQMALKTNALNPRHQFVPWFTMNGYHTQAIQNGLLSNMLAYVCNAYQGVKPQGCYSQEDLQVCYKEDVKEEDLF